MSDVLPCPVGVVAIGPVVLAALVCVQNVINVIIVVSEVEGARVRVLLKLRPDARVRVVAKQPLHRSSSWGGGYVPCAVPAPRPSTQTPTPPPSSADWQYRHIRQP